MSTPDESWNELFSFMKPVSGVQHEPASANREAAAATYSIYAAYVQAGFSAEQAMQLLIAMIGTSVITGLLNPPDGDV